MTRRRVLNAGMLDDGAFANVAVRWDDLMHLARVPIGGRPATKTLCGRPVDFTKRDSTDARCVVCAARFAGQTVPGYLIRRAFGRARDVDSK